MSRRSLRLFAALALALPLFAYAATLPASAQQKLPPEKRPGSIAGVVQSAPGVPAIGATVSVIGTVLQTLVQPDGTFQISEVPPGLYDVVASGAAYQPSTIEDVSVRPSQQTTITITLRRYPILSDVRVSTPARKSQPIYESSASVSVLDANDASFRSGHTVDRILLSSPGVTLSGGLPSVRGSSGSPLGVGSRVGLFVDGIPLTTPDLGGPLYSAVPLAAVEQIEVVKGSATTLYGPGVISGAINIVTPRPAERQKAKVGAFTGVYTDPEPAAAKWWGSRPLRFSGVDVMWTRRSRSLGILVAGTAVTDDGFRQFEQQDRYDLLARLNVFLPAGAELRLTGIVSDYEHGPQSVWRGYDSALFTSVPDSALTDASTASRTLGVEYRGVDSKSFSFVLRGVYQGVSVDDLLPDSTSRRSSAGRYFAEAQLTSFINRRISFAYGALAQYDVGSSPQYGDGLTRTVGGYARMEFSNLYDIVASLGLRADMVLMPESDASSVLELSPSVGVAYHPIPSTSFRASITRGYRAPTLAERRFHSVRNGVAIVPNPSLGPEQSWQGEVGAAHRIELGSASITGDAAFYVHEYFGMIEPLYNAASGLLSFVNLNRARMLGADIGAQVSIDRGLLVGSLSFALLSARDLRTGGDLPGRSPMSAIASLVWHPDPLRIIATYRYNARVPVVDEATTTLVPDADKRFATNLVALHVGLDLGRYIQLPVSVYLEARNLMQSRGFDGLGVLAPIRNVEAGLQLVVNSDVTAQ